ncbi:DUF4921 family protein [uncultured Lamprocystis sp.]|uniref:DUF4921 family protein n=1 Tax=uncultured Lamprocystis sp. TaxID=543132 RepID=UPI00341D78B9
MNEPGEVVRIEGASDNIPSLHAYDITARYGSHVVPGHSRSRLSHAHGGWNHQAGQSFSHTEVWTVPGRGNRPLRVSSPNPSPLTFDSDGKC